MRDHWQAEDHGRLHERGLGARRGRGVWLVCRYPGRGWGEGQTGLAAVGLMLGIRGTAALGREDISGGRDGDTSHIMLREYLLTLVFAKPALSKGMRPAHVDRMDSGRETDAN